MSVALQACNVIAGIEEPREANADASVDGSECSYDDVADACARTSPGRDDDARSGSESSNDVAATMDASRDGPPTTVRLDITVTNDGDDCTWIDGTDERLHYDADSLYGEIGGDREAGRIGLRFALDVPAGAAIQSAILELHRTIGDAPPTETMRVQVYDSADVPTFDESHTHKAEAHDPGGLWAITVGGISVGADGTKVTTPELKGLVQHVVNRTDWKQANHIGFVLSADEMAVHWVDYADSKLGTGQPVLRVVYAQQE